MCVVGVLGKGSENFKMTFRKWDNRQDFSHDSAPKGTGKGVLHCSRQHGRCSVNRLN